MAFHDAKERVGPTSKPVYLMTATVRNEFHERWQPRIVVLYVQRPGAKEAADRLNFVMDSEGRMEEEDARTGNHYLLRFQLDRGRYELPGMMAVAHAFPIHGLFFVPLHATLDVQEPGVYYLGHLEATVRERVGDEFRAGPLIPLIDQAIAGASNGTFEIRITDEFATDEALFRSKFPALDGVSINKAILPAFDRAKAQTWWERQ